MVLKDTIHVTHSGGSVPKYYPPNATNHGYLFGFSTDTIDSILKRVGLANMLWTQSVACLVDSLDMTELHRQAIRLRILESRSKYQIVLHGTDTAHITAEYLARILPRQVIIITGATQPEKYRETDADFNLGMAVGAMRWLKPGVYIALNGSVMPWQEYKP